MRFHTYNTKFSNVKTYKTSRRDLLKTASVGAMATSLPFMTCGKVKASETLAINGGPKTVTAPDAWTWPLFGEEQESVILNLVRNPSYDDLPKLEQEWCQNFGAKYAKSHCNGTGALTSMFFVLSQELPPGSEILVPSYTFFATIVPMRLFGFVPRFVDINPQTLNMDVEDLKRKWTPQCKAVVPVHWIGLPCDMDQICDFAKEKDLIVLEDACHAQGAKLQDKFMGTWGRMGAYSFQCTKALPGIEGGMGVYQNKADYAKAAAYGHYKGNVGECAKYNGTGLGVKLRIHPMAAALVRSQIPGHFDLMKARNKQTRTLNDQLMQLPGLLEQTSGRNDMDRIHYAWNMLFVDEKKAGINRDQAARALQAEGVQVTPGFSYSLQHCNTLYAEKQWWHHAPHVPTREEMPGSFKANEWALNIQVFTKECPELVEQYVKAFQKVWANRDKVAKL